MARTFRTPCCRTDAAMAHSARHYSSWTWADAAACLRRHCCCCCRCLEDHSSADSGQRCVEVCRRSAARDCCRAHLVHCVSLPMRRFALQLLEICSVSLNSCQKLHTILLTRRRRLSTLTARYRVRRSTANRAGTRRTAAILWKAHLLLGTGAQAEVHRDLSIGVG